MRLFLALYLAEAAAAPTLTHMSALYTTNCSLEGGRGARGVCQRSPIALEHNTRPLKRLRDNGPDQGKS